MNNANQKTFLCNGNPGIIYRNRFIVFMPTRMQIVELTPKEYKAIKKSKESISPLDPGNTTFDEHTARLRLIVTRDCNLRCRYCFARGGEDRVYLNPKIAKRALDRIIKRDTKFINIDFFGGEPTLNQRCIMDVVEYAKTKGVGVVYSITSNGVIKRDFLEYMIDNGFIFKISVDGLEKYHNIMRPFASGDGSYDAVFGTIKELSRRGAKFSLRVTVTSKNVKDMNRIVRKYATFKPQYIHFEPVHIEGRGESLKTLKPSSKDYVRSFKKAMDAGKDLRVRIVSSSFLNLYKPCSLFCSSLQGNNIIVTPDGLITLCLGVQNCKHAYSDYFIVGKFDGKNKFVYDADKIKKVAEDADVDGLKRCKDCFARYICSGSCIFKNKSSMGGFDKYSCDINSQLLYEAILRIWKESKMS